MLIMTQGLKRSLNRVVPYKQQQQQQQKPKTDNDNKKLFEEDWKVLKLRISYVKYVL